MSEEKPKYMKEEREDNVYEIREEAPHDFFCQIPNLVDELNLSPYAYRLYGHFKRVAGESGKCWQSTRTLADKCRMSMGSVSDAKKELESTYPPLIKVTSKTKDNGMYHEVVITDIWYINHDYWTGKDVHIVKSPPSRSQSEHPRSPSETKKNPVKEEPNNGFAEENLPLDWKVGLGVSITDDDMALQEDKRRIDNANLIATGFGVNSTQASNLAYAFMVARNLTIPESKIKGQRKAIKELIEMKVTPKNVVDAVRELTAKNMTVVDLFSIVKTAVDLANKPIINSKEKPL